MKIHSMGAEFFHVDGQTDMMTPIVTSRDVANAPKTRPFLHVPYKLSFSCPQKIYTKFI